MKTVLRFVLFVLLLGVGGKVLGQGFLKDVPNPSSYEYDYRDINKKFTLELIANIAESKININLKRGGVSKNTSKTFVELAGTEDQVEAKIKTMIPVLLLNIDGSLSNSFKDEVSNGLIGLIKTKANEEKRNDARLASIAIIKDLPLENMFEYYSSEDKKKFLLNFNDDKEVKEIRFTMKLNSTIKEKKLNYEILTGTPTEVENQINNALQDLLVKTDANLDEAGKRKSAANFIDQIKEKIKVTLNENGKRVAIQEIFRDFNNIIVSEKPPRAGLFEVKRSLKDKNGKKVDVDSLSIKIENASITEIIADTKLGEEPCQYRFIGVIRLKTFSTNNIFKRKNDKTNYFSKIFGKPADELQLISQQDDSKIGLSEIISYTPQLISGTRDYSPTDTVITYKFTDNQGSNAKINVNGKPFRKQLSIYTFTDATSLFSNAPNGLLQLEGAIDFIVSGRTNRHWNWFESARISATYSQQNTYNSSVAIRYQDGKNGSDGNSLGIRFVNLFDLIRYSRFRVSNRFNLVTIPWYWGNMTFRLYADQSYYLTYCKDTSYNFTTSGGIQIRNANIKEFSLLSSQYGLGLTATYAQPQYNIFFDGQMFNFNSISFKDNLQLDKGFLVDDPYGRNLYTSYIQSSYPVELKWDFNSSDKWLKINLPFTRISFGGQAFINDEKTKIVMLRFSNLFCFWNENRSSFWQIQAGYNYQFGVGSSIKTTEGVTSKVP